MIIGNTDYAVAAPAFNSDAFPIVAGEDEEVNPGIYGKTLSEWLAEKLATKNIKVLSIFADDFGRLIEIETHPFNLFVVCASESGSKNQFCVFVLCEGAALQCLFSKKVRSKKAQLMGTTFATVQSILQATNEISHLQVIES
ncbi:hypothetical protein VQ643_00485 [Pseudomonas sp. F1_0610]|uniref:hypothetical protein n=1 Tax=Pseudomonas sp. F1_0610 TaxID=3114284 RepID=UPI0039C1E084